MVHTEVFAWNHHLRMVGNGLKLCWSLCCYAEKRLLGFVKSTYIDATYHIIRVEAHGVVCHGKDEPWQEIKCKLAGLLPCYEQGEDCDEIQTCHSASFLFITM